MKRYILIGCLFLLNNFSIYCQNFSYKGLKILANTNYTNAILGSQSTVGQPIKTTIAVVAQPNFGVSVDGVFSLTKKLDLSIGLGVNTLYFKQRINGLTWGSDLDPQIGFRSSTTYYDSKLLEINLPINVIYGLKNNQSIEFGLTTSTRLNKKSEFYTIRDDDNLKTVVSENSEILVRNVNFSVSTGYNVKFKVKDKMNFVLQPYAAIHVLGDELKLFYVSNYFYQLGLKLGVELQPNNGSPKAKLKKKKIGG
jgi:hypothetical protein